VATFSPTLNFSRSVWLMASWPPPRSRSAAKFSMPRTRLSPLVCGDLAQGGGVGDQEVRRREGVGQHLGEELDPALGAGIDAIDLDTRLLSQFDDSR
jgi:hypothetical protein